MADYVVTGASGGIGRGLTAELVRRGHRVWGIARRGDRLAALQDTLGPECFYFSSCDVARRDEVQAVAARMRVLAFEPDVVILNAGINPERFGHPFRADEFEHVVHVNLFGAMAWVDLLLPLFRERGRGQFVAISSLAAYRGDARWVAYCASKAALTRAFEALRGRHSGEGVRFTTVHLGAVDVGMGAASRSLFRLTWEEAVRAILAAADRGAASVTVPRILRLVLEAMRVLPDRTFSRLVSAAFVPEREVGEGPTAEPAAVHGDDS